MFLVPKLRLGNAVTSLRGDHAFLSAKRRTVYKYGRLGEPIGIVSFILSQRGALREGIPKRSLGTRNGVWEREKKPIARIVYKKGFFLYSYFCLEVSSLVIY